MIKHRLYFAISIVSCGVAMFSCRSNSNTETSAVVLDTALLGQKKYAFTYQQDNKTVISSADTINQVSFGGTARPAIAPDGSKVAYIVKDSVGNNSIWMADLEQKSQLQFKLPGNGYEEAIWSPSGNAIAFTQASGNGFKIGKINTDNTGYVVVEGTSKQSLYGPTWKSDTEILAHDLIHLYTFNTEGKQTDALDLASITGKDIKATQHTRFFYTRDGKQLVFNASNTEKPEGFRGVPEAIYILDLSTKKVSKISPAGLHTPYVFLTADDRIFYSGMEKPYTQSAVYVADLNGKTRKISVLGSDPTAANK